MAKSTPNSQPKPGADSNPSSSSSLEVSYGSAIVQPKGFAKGTENVIGCMAGDWSVSTARTISGADPGERANKKEKGY